MNALPRSRRHVAQSVIKPTRIIRFTVLAVFLAGCRDATQPTAPRVPRDARLSVATLTAATNGKIAFASNRGGAFAIYLMNPDGSGVTQLTTAGAFSPDWSRDGTKLAFECNDEICVINADGSGVTQLTTNAVATHPSWSADGTKLAFESARDGNNEIYVMNADGSGQTNLTNHLLNDKEPSWSPDGTKIAFASHREGSSQIFVMNPDGTAPTRLTNTGGLNDVPAWSPDGSKIVWHSTRAGPSDLWVMNADGSAPTRLTNNSFPLNFLPAWSPDGTKIAFSSLRGDIDIYVVNADGSGEAQLTSGPAPDFGAAWQPLPVDSDGDGVPNARDLCPGTPTGASVDADGCIPQQSIGRLEARVDALLNDGTLTSDQAAALKDKLTAALASINAGRNTATCGQLGAFANQVSALINSGALSPQTAAELLAAASAIPVQIGC